MAGIKSQVEQTVHSFTWKAPLGMEWFFRCSLTHDFPSLRHESSLFIRIEPLQYRLSCWCEDIVVGAAAQWQGSQWPLYHQTSLFQV